MEKLKALERLLIFGGEKPALSTGRRVLEYAIYAGSVAMLGYIDFLTGIEIVIFTFYMIPVRVAALRLGLTGGIVISALATLAWSLSDYCAGQSYSGTPAFAWNISVRLMSFLIVAWLSARNATLFARERATSAELRKALSEIKLMEGLLPICASCKKIRDGNGNWNVLESYIQDHTAATFTHGLCPECAREWTKQAGV